MSDKVVGEMERISRGGQFGRRDFLKFAVAGTGTLAVPHYVIDWGGEGPQSKSELKYSIPDANIDFMYVWHTTSSDLREFEPALKKCDVLCPEWIDWDPSIEAYLNNVSKGFVSDSQIESQWNNPFVITMLKTLRGTGKRVKLVDIPKDNQLTDEFYQIDRESIINFSLPYDKIVRELPYKLQNEAEWMRKREDFILKNIKDYVDELKQKDPYRQGRKINVLLVLGLAHTRPLHQLKTIPNNQNETAFSFPMSRFSYLHSTEALRRYYFAQDPSNSMRVDYPDKKLISNVVMEKMLIYWLYPKNAHLFPDTASAVNWFRGVVEKANKNGLESKILWEEMRKMRNGIKSLRDTQISEEMKAILTKHLEECGVDKKYLQS